MNRKAIEAVGEPDYVVLMFDRRQSTIGMKAATSSRQTAFRLKRKGLKAKCSGRVIYASNFCRFHQLSLEETLSFTAAEVDKNGVLILSLHEVKPARRL